RAMASEVRAGRPPADVMHRLRAARQAAESAGQPSGGRAAQRNAPCPCGSGRKFKHCCGQASGG
ncbi:MAG TPA: SEC-C metal-binding domain-containing protein, partial [Pirellulales bacterium]